MFSGSLSLNCVTPYYLMVLDLSNNRFEGKLPTCWENMPYLGFLNLANNSFSGEIPLAFGNFLLQTLHLANNNFSGEFPLALKNYKWLSLIDIGGNMLTGSIPTWIGKYKGSMKYLILRNNRFHGSIPPQICHLSSIKVLDLSGNSISGKIPPCFSNFTYLVDKANTSEQIINPLMFLPQVRGLLNTIIERQRLITKSRESAYTTVLWKHIESKYTRNLYLLKLIDLSHNRLDGDIPSSFSSLKELRSLNLSRNRLTGVIDPNIGQMSSLESLDLSSNQLVGMIPNGIVGLNFLSALDLANNKLSGKIPTGTQLQTFPATAYDGNIGLCGSPLLPCSRVILNPSTNNEAQNVGSVWSSSFVKDVEFVISIILGFIFGFWGVVGSLIVNKSWRRMFYIFWGEVGDWLYVRWAIFWRKLRRRS